MRTDPDRYVARRLDEHDPVHVPGYVRSFDLDADEMLDWWTHFRIAVRLQRWRDDFHRQQATTRRRRPKEGTR
jgi:hypothetical protein